MNIDRLEASEYRNPTDALLMMMERSQLMYVDALHLGGWPIDVIIAAYTCGANKDSEQYRECIGRANDLSKRDKEKYNLPAFVDWVWKTVSWNIDANLGPRVMDTSPQEQYDLFVEALEGLLENPAPEGP